MRGRNECVFPFIHSSVSGSITKTAEPGKLWLITGAFSDTRTMFGKRRFVSSAIGIKLVWCRDETSTDTGRYAMA